MLNVFAVIFFRVLTIGGRSPGAVRKPTRRTFRPNLADARLEDIIVPAPIVAVPQALVWANGIIQEVPRYDINGRWKDATPDEVNVEIATWSTKKDAWSAEYVSSLKKGLRDVTTGDTPYALGPNGELTTKAALAKEAALEAAVLAGTMIRVRVGNGWAYSPAPSKPVVLSPAPATPAVLSPAAAAEKVWASHAANDAKTLANDKELTDALAQAAKTSKYLTLADLRTIVSIESGANRAAKNGDHVGLFQIGRSAAADTEKTDARLRYDQLDDPNEWRTNIAAGVAYLDIVAGRLPAGVSVTALNVYLAYQQGAAGAKQILAQVKDGSAATLPASINQLNNLDDAFKKNRAVTVQDYYEYLSAAFLVVSQAANGTPAK